MFVEHYTFTLKRSKCLSKYTCLKNQSWRILNKSKKLTIPGLKNGRFIIIFFIFLLFLFTFTLFLPFFISPVTLPVPNLQELKIILTHKLLSPPFPLVRSPEGHSVVHSIPQQVLTESQVLGWGLKVHPILRYIYLSIQNNKKSEHHLL